MTLGGGKDKSPEYNKSSPDWRKVYKREGEIGVSMRGKVDLGACPTNCGIPTTI